VEDCDATTRNIPHAPCNNHSLHLIRLAAQPALKTALQDGSACNHTTRFAPPSSSQDDGLPSKEGF
jgi:hypothetical protein